MTIITLGVLAGAYLRSDDRRAFLTHATELETGVVLCRRVKRDNLADRFAYSREELDAQPSCPVCARKDPRFPKP